jgi:hypothetical protein
MRRSPSRGRPSSNRTKVPATVRAAVEQRSRGRCEIEHPRCTGEATQMHHRLRRSQGGPHTAENLLHLCNAGHQYVHHHTGLSYEKGWLIRSGPASAPPMEPDWPGGLGGRGLV